MSFSYVECNRCKKEFCIGCSRKRQEYEYGNDEKTCLKGYLKALYLRIINRRSEMDSTLPVFYVLHIILCLFFTPLFLGFISNVIGLIPHKKKITEKNIDDIWNDVKICSIIISSIFRGIFMIPYMILFFPFMFILLLPGIFSHTYYLYIFDAYVAAILPGSFPLTNVGEN